MDKARLDILETKEVRGFNAVEWIKKQIDGVKREFEKDYDLSSIAVGISAGIPRGVSGSLAVTLSPKLLKEPCQEYQESRIIPKSIVLFNVTAEVDEAGLRQTLREIQRRERPPVRLRSKR
jgi:hypothetical protein